MLSYVIKLILLLRNATCIKINKAEKNRVGSNLVCMHSECEIWQNFTTTICYIESRKCYFQGLSYMFIVFILFLMM